VTLQQLRYFLASAELGSFTAAADRLRLTQPAVAEQIRGLERELGTELFARLGRGVRLTASGREFARQARRVIAAADDAVETVADVNALRRGTHAFGAFGATGAYRLADVFEQFVLDHPGIRLRVIGRNSSTTAAAVRAGDVEAGLVVLPVDDDGLDLRPVIRDEVLYVSGDPRRTATPVGVDQLAGRPLILYEAEYAKDDPTRRQLTERAQAQGGRLEAAIEVEFADTALQLAARGVGDSYAPRALVHAPGLPAGLTATSFDPPLYDTLALIKRRASRLSAPMRTLTHRVEVHMRQMEAELHGSGTR
jgi:DNA-binding transcriptional LysR family regulator